MTNVTKNIAEENITRMSKRCHIDKLDFIWNLRGLYPNDSDMPNRYKLLLTPQYNYNSTLFSVSSWKRLKPRINVELYVNAAKNLQILWKPLDHANFKYKNAFERDDFKFYSSDNGCSVYGRPDHEIMWVKGFDHINISAPRQSCFGERNPAVEKCFLNFIIQDHKNLINNLKKNFEVTVKNEIIISDDSYRGWSIENIERTPEET